MKVTTHNADPSQSKWPPGCLHLGSDGDSNGDYDAIDAILTNNVDNALSTLDADKMKGKSIWNIWTAIKWERKFQKP